MKAHATWRMPQPQITQGCTSGHGMRGSNQLWRTGLSWAGSPGVGEVRLGKGCPDSLSWEPSSRTRIQGRGRSKTWPQHEAAGEDSDRPWSYSWALFHAHQAGEPSCPTEGMDEPGAGPEALLPGQGPAVCHRPPAYRRGKRDFSKLVITSVFLSWIHLSWLITVVHRGSNSCPTLYFSTSPLTVSLLVSTWHYFFFCSRQKDTSHAH